MRDQTSGRIQYEKRVSSPVSGEVLTEIDALPLPTDARADMIAAGDVLLY
ncbi:MAG: hypothetical protein NUW12_09290 [Firmicutes bacterium]|nr:hypothetical protein [Bacillota bacterium]MDH7496180.1 hypothetical protein [Bacillota bacterium]